MAAFPPTVTIWQPVAFIHLQSARLLRDEAAEFESMHDGSLEKLHQYWACVTSSIFASAAFLEALINETFLRTVAAAKGKPLDNTLQKVSPTAIASMAQAWQNGVGWNNEPDLLQFLTSKKSSLKSHHRERWYFLDKYQLALYFVEKPSFKRMFDKTGKFWEDLSCLKELRNSLTHHAAETVSFPPSGDPYEAETQRTTTLLRNLLKRNLTSGLYGRGSILSFLGSKSANWAVDLSTTLAREFRDRMPLDPARIPGL